MTSSIVRIVEKCLSRATQSDRAAISALLAKPVEIVPAVGDDSWDARFARFWAEVHLRKGKHGARAAFVRAVRRKAAEFPDVTVPEGYAAAWITQRMRVFASSPEAKPTEHSPIHPATWLNKGRYDDDPADWGIRDAQQMVYNGGDEEAADDGNLDAGGL